MKLYDLTLTVQSALGTPLAADTLFGHICWGIRYADGVKALTEFLEAFDAGKPPLLLSDPFPAGYWPIPILPKPVPEDEDRLLVQLKKSSRSNLKEKLPDCPLAEYSSSLELSDAEAFDMLKWLYKLRWLDVEAFARLAEDVSIFSILRYFISDGCGAPNMPSEAMIAHNTINRLSGTTAEQGSLYFARELHVDPENSPKFHLLAASDEYSDADIDSIFENALQGGYGKYKSKGKGKLTLEGVNPAELPVVTAPNAVMLLGPCAPAEKDPAEGYWHVFTRFGKLGGDWATGPGPEGKHNPYKRPVTMLKAGSVLKTDQPKAYYGRLIGNVHGDFKEVRHYGMALAMPIHCDFKEPA